MPGAVMWVGRWWVKSILAVMGGLKNRKAWLVAGGWWLVIRGCWLISRNGWGWWVFRSSGMPTLASPTMARILASVSSSLSGAGVMGRKIPAWMVRGWTGFRMIESAIVAACGGWASRSIWRSFKSDLLSRIGTGRRRVRMCWVLSSSSKWMVISFADMACERSLSH